MRVAVLAENTAVSEDFSYEHGLSLYIESDDKKILFDMGQSALFAENAIKLGIDLADVDFAVISHGHYDHAGGLKTFLDINSKAKVYIRRNAFCEHYNALHKYIGIDKSLEKSNRLVFTDDVFEICDRMTLYSCNDRNFRHSESSSEMWVLRDGQFVPDEFFHEHYLLITEGEKRILFSGCSHKGIINITLFSRYSDRRFSFLKDRR